MRYVLIPLFLALAAGNVLSQNRVTDSLIALTGKPGIHDTVKIKLYGDISWELMGSDINKAKEYAQKELDLSAKMDRKSDVAQAQSDLGNIYNRQSVFDTALMHYQEALKIRKELKQTEKVAGIYNNMATVYMRQTKFKEALSMNFEALKVFEEIGSLAKQANILSNIAIIYRELNQKQVAETFFKRGLKLAKEERLPVIEGRILVNLAGLKFEMYENDTVQKTQIDSALYYYLEAEKIMTGLNDLYNMSVVQNGMGSIYSRKREYDKAIAYFEKALKNRESLGDRYGIALSLLGLGDANYNKKNYDKAIHYFNQCIPILTEVKNYLNLKQAYSKLAKAYHAKKEYGLAFKFFELYDRYKDSVYTGENARQMAEMQTKYETEKKELENKELKDQNIIKELEIEKQTQRHFIKNVVIASVLGLFVLLSLLGYLFYKRKQLQLKAEQDAELARQKEIRTKSIIEAEEKERKRIAQDLHDGVGQILSAAKLNLSALESKVNLEHQDQKDAYKNALDLIDDSVREVREVSHNMMPNTLIKLGLASAIREFITKVGNIPTLKIDLEIVGLDSRINESVETVLYRVIQETVNNILKHAKATHISLQLVRHDTELTVMIEDNGVGFDTEKISEFAGIGLKNIISRIEFLNGTVHFDSIPGRGTNVIIEVPA